MILVGGLLVTGLVIISVVVWSVALLCGGTGLPMGEFLDGVVASEGYSRWACRLGGRI